MWGDAIDGLVVDGNEKVTKVVSSVGPLAWEKLGCVERSAKGCGMMMKMV